MVAAMVKVAAAGGGLRLRNGDTRLILASLQGHKWVVKLVAGAEVNHAPTNGDTPPVVFARQTQTRKRGHTQGGGGSAAGVGVDRCGGSRTPEQYKSTSAVTLQYKQ